MTFNFSTTYADELSGLYIPYEGEMARAPKLVWLNESLARELNLDVAFLKSTRAAQYLTGGHVPQGAKPLAQTYAGHQFGGFSPQLGDGRALLLGEVTNKNGTRLDLHLKGSGRTPFSRGGDGKAAIAPVLRECLIGEAMHALGVPTTRALAAFTTGETIARETALPGAVLVRVAASHIRVGTFQFFAVRGDMEKLKRLADYAIARHCAWLVEAPDKYLKFLSAVIEQQCATIAKWMAVGFVHGVMNTDNTTISGETIDYGPCAFIDDYDPHVVYSSIDENGRYAFGNQPNIIHWNLTRFAESLLPLIAPDNREYAIELAKAALQSVPAAYRAAWLAELAKKLGLEMQASAPSLIDELHQILVAQKVDYTLFFRALAKCASGHDSEFLKLFEDATAAKLWLQKWKNCIAAQAGGLSQAAEMMNRVNPLYSPRNYKVEAALNAATQGDYSKFETMVKLLTQPFENISGMEDYALPPPPNSPKCITYCGT
jgi:serine/tyrosine/threonine adenylyltransferase